MTEAVPSPNAVSPDTFQAFIDNIEKLRGIRLGNGMPADYEIDAAIESAKAYQTRCQKSGVKSVIGEFLQEETDSIYDGQSFNEHSPGNDGADAMGMLFEIYNAAHTATEAQYPTVRQMQGQVKRPPTR